MVENSVEGREQIGRNRRVIMAGPSFLAGFAYIPGQEEPEPVDRIIDTDLLFDLYVEYRTIHDKVVQAVGIENVVVAKTSSILEESLVDTTAKEAGLSMPVELSCGETEISYLAPFFACWPRNALTQIDGHVFVTPEAWRGQDGQAILSPLGNGGQVIVREKSVIVTPAVWNSCQGILKALQTNGVKVAKIPRVNPVHQRYLFHEDDIDGHVGLVVDNKGGLHLLVAKSYFKQGPYQGSKTAQTIRMACDIIGAELVVINDKYLPPLALNMLQLDDTSVVFTGPKDSCLSEQLTTIVGLEKVFPTDTPIHLIPRHTHGGIGCLTNMLPSEF